jgi:DnaJ-related protein SCJ1
MHFCSFGFGGQRRSAEEQRGDDLELDLFVSLKDLYLGRIISVEVQNKKICHHCRGSGAKSEAHTHTCHACGGRGMRTQRIQLAPGMFQQMTQTCDVCGGTGKIVKEKCPICKGDKVVTGMSELDLYVERGMPDGHKIVCFSSDYSSSYIWS